MKKSTLILLFLVLQQISFAQDSSATKNYKNEIGIDATGFIRQFLNFGSGQIAYFYNPDYFFTYRRHFKCGNIRAAVRGNFGNTETVPTDNTRAVSYKINFYSYSFRIGWEFVNEISNRWSVFYGLDFRPQFDYNKNENTFFDNSNGNSSSSFISAQRTSYSFSPVLGFKFKLNKRFSLSTEAAYIVGFGKSSQKGVNTYYFLGYTTVQSSSFKTSSSYSGFRQPLSVNFSFDF